MRAGVIRNPRSWHNERLRHAPDLPADVLHAVTASPEELEAALKDFAAAGVDLVVVHGGDGTLREVASRLPEIFPERLPRIAVLHGGKTNALAADLLIPRRRTVEDVLALAEAGEGWEKQRTCLEVWRAGAAAPEHRGFIFGMGIFLRATRLAQKTHSAGVFGRPAVALAVAAGARQVFFGGPKNPWRYGDPMEVTLGEEPTTKGNNFLLLASTLKRFPLGWRPFGEPREGLKALSIAGPPRRLVRALWPVITGRDADWLEDFGYHRHDGGPIEISVEGCYVLDGEIYPAGDITVRHGPALTFVA